MQIPMCRVEQTPPKGTACFAVLMIELARCAASNDKKKPRLVKGNLDGHIMAQDQPMRYRCKIAIYEGVNKARE